MTEQDWYGKSEAKILAGIAVLWMMCHHFFGFSNFLRDDVRWIPMFAGDGFHFDVELIVAGAGNFCVAMFAFQSGYVAWKNRVNFSRLHFCLSRICKFLCFYWFVCALFWIYGILLGESLPSDWRDYLMNLVGLGTGPDLPYVNVVFAWYVAYYICFMLLVPWVLRVMALPPPSGYVVDCLLFAVALTFTMLPSSGSIDFIKQLPFSIWGIIAAKYRILDKLCRFFDKTHWILLLGVFLIVSMRKRLWFHLQLEPLIIKSIECVLVMAFAAAVIVLVRKRPALILWKLLTVIGVYSMSIWYVHGIFFTGSRPLQPLLYASECPVLIYLFGFVMSLALAWAVSSLYSFVGVILKRIRQTI